MKKIIAALVIGFCYTAGAVENASIWQVSEDNSSKGAAYFGNLANETSLAYDRVFTYDFADKGLNRVSAMVKYGSAMLTTDTFTDGRTSAGTATVLSTVSLCGTVFSFNGNRFNMGGCPPYSTYTDTLVTIGANVTTTASNLCHQVSAHNTATLAITTCTFSSGVISFVSKAADGIAYTLASTGSSITVSGAAMASGVAATVAINDIITIAGHGYSTGSKVALSGSSLPTGLSATDYYVIKLGANTISLASSLANAIAGTAEDITAVTVGTSAHTFTLTPYAITGTPSFKWQMSNDNVNFYDVPIEAVSITEYTAPYASVGFDFDMFNYRYLTLNAVAPTTGGLYLNAQIYVKK